jgi:CheY-like chemotaxis protein
MEGLIVYVEDEPDDAFFMERALKQCAPGLELKLLNDGQQAFRFFESDEETEMLSGSRPGLVLLDLNLPGRSGLEVLQKIRARARLQRVPVIIFTSSNQAVDIRQAYDSGCTGYLVKPRSADKLKGMVTALTGFWIKDNQYPPAG